uniref:Uncharacterized protein n=1 Tax=Opuntia streptacantha TaxID=393608 RepID=A0A7C9ACH4_OPUST
MDFAKGYFLLCVLLQLIQVLRIIFCISLFFEYCQFRITTGLNRNDRIANVDCSYAILGPKFKFLVFQNSVPLLSPPKTTPSPHTLFLPPKQTKNLINKITCCSSRH